MSSDSDGDPLLEVATPRWRKKSAFTCLSIFSCGCLALAAAITAGYFLYIHKNTVGFKVMALNTWGMPATFGAYDKEIRMQAIGKHLQQKEYDVYLLEELWMRPDHATIKSLLPEGYYMTEVSQFSRGSGLITGCDGVVAPDGCSGLAIASRFPFIDIEFLGFSEHGDWKKATSDGEYLARKGVGRVRIEPETGTLVDVFVTHTCASDYNSWYRERQVEELVAFVERSDADFVILGGDFNVDPVRNKNEKTYNDVKNAMTNSMEEFFKTITEWLIPKRATYANPSNTYSANLQPPSLYDYIFHKAKRNNSMWTNFFDVPFLKFPKLVSNGSVVEGSQRLSFSDHEAVTASLLLWKSSDN